MSSGADQSERAFDQQQDESSHYVGIHLEVLYAVVSKNTQSIACFQSRNVCQEPRQQPNLPLQPSPGHLLDDISSYRPN